MLDRRLIVFRGLAALLTAALSLGIMAVMPREAELSPGWRTPIIALELAETDADVAFLAGDGAKDVRAAVHSGQSIDMVFPFAYAALLLLTLMLSTTSRRLRLAGALVAVVVVGADLAENLVLFDVLGRLDSGASIMPLFGSLAAATWAKWLAIALLVALIGVARWPTSVPTMKVKAGLCLALLPLTVIAAVARTPMTGELMALAVVVTIASFVIGGLVGLRRTTS